MSAKVSSVSTKFPEGYGDLAIRSRDDVVCYFPRPILSHASVVFRDMFSLGPNNAKSSSQFVHLTESIITLELFLTHLDPNILTPYIDPETIEDLMLMAHKYQTAVIMDWFEREIAVERKTKEQPQKAASLLSTHPLLTLSIAIRLNLQRASKLALAETLECHTDILSDGPSSLPTTVYLTIHKYREERIKRYNGWIQQLAEATLPSRASSGCVNCPTRKATWVFGMAKAVQSSPSWSSFSSAYNNRGACCATGFILCQSDHVDRWARDARQAEATLPPGIV